MTEDTTTSSDTSDQIDIYVSLNNTMPKSADKRNAANAAKDKAKDKAKAAKILDHTKKFASTPGMTYNLKKHINSKNNSFGLGVFDRLGFLVGGLPTNLAVLTNTFKNVTFEVIGVDAESIRLNRTEIIMTSNAYLRLVGPKININSIT